MSVGTFRDEHGGEHAELCRIRITCDRWELGKHPAKYRTQTVAIAHLIKDFDREMSRANWGTDVSFPGNMPVLPSPSLEWRLSFPGGGGQTLELGYHPKQLPDGEPQTQRRATIVCRRCGNRGDVVDFRQGTYTEVFDALRHAGREDVSLRELSATLSTRGTVRPST